MSDDFIFESDFIMCVWVWLWITKYKLVPYAISYSDICTHGSIHLMEFVHLLQTLDSLDDPRVFKRCASFVHICPSSCVRVQSTTMLIFVMNFRLRKQSANGQLDNFNFVILFSTFDRYIWKMF